MGEDSAVITLVYDEKLIMMMNSCDIMVFKKRKEMKGNRRGERSLVSGAAVLCCGARQ